MGLLYRRFYKLQPAPPGTNVKFYFHFLYILYTSSRYYIAMEGGGSREPPLT